ncbi:MAG: nicotinamide riboside transporter PnuC, partial [Clostridiales bacterium]|nr:nicotinamide riboside transporter PnuC [Clostridiales bacterium]
MQKAREFFKDWKTFEKAWLFVFLIIIVATTVYFSATDTDYSNLEKIVLNWAISPISAISGIFCVVLAAKGKFSNWIWGIANSILYGYLAYRSGYYGDMIINIFFFLPTQFIGIVAWKKMLQKGSKTDVKMRQLTQTQSALLLVAALVLTIVFGLALDGVDSFFTNSMQRSQSIYSYFTDITGFPLLGPILDSSTEV